MESNISVEKGTKSGCVQITPGEFFLIPHSPEGIRPVPWQVGQVMLSLPVNSTYGNWAISSRLSSPSRESLSDSVCSVNRPSVRLSG